MGNILDLLQPRNALVHSHPNETHHGGITDDQVEAFYEKGITDVRSQLWSTISRRAMSELIRRKRVYGKGISNYQCQLFCILIFRTISECICYKAIYEKGITDVPFQLWSILFCRAISEHICRKLNYQNGISDRHFRLCTFLICGVMSDYINCKPAYKFRLGNNDPFEYLPEDVLCIILPKLQLKELFHGRVVEELSIRCEFATILVDHLDSWVTEITFNAVKLTTFIYKGRPVPIDLIQSSELEIAEIFFGNNDTLVPTSTLLRNVLTNAQKLSFAASCIQPEVPFLTDNACKFSQLKHMGLVLLYFDDLHSLSLVSFLRSAPFIEKLDLRFSASSPPPAVQEPVKRLPECPFNYLKRLYIDGYKGSNGQVEFLVHMVENASALEILTLKQIVQDALFDYDIYRAARKYLDGKISPKCAIRCLQ
uniref:At1g61320/AtMIF1 LRR domain-containing protein n=1 Tax=Leersia perrieri TaxID=77586 RepID=A0A0D9XHD5_9ORYZ